MTSTHRLMRRLGIIAPPSLPLEESESEESSNETVVLLNVQILYPLRC